MSLDPHPRVDPWVEVSLGDSGLVALVDASDAESVLAHRWHVLRPRGSRTRYYVQRTWKEGGKTHAESLHRALLRPPPHLLVDHINGDGLDNRRCNLRLCTPAENARNSRLALNNTSGFKGVKKRKRSPSFSAYIYQDNKGIELGCYPTAIEAARAYDAAAVRLHGEFAHLNFPAEREAALARGMPSGPRKRAELPKEAAIARAAEVGFAQAGREFGLAPDTISRWSRGVRR